MARHENWMRRYLKAMVGCTVRRVGVNGEGYPYFVLQNGDTSFTVEVSQDEEGNGPGFLFGLPLHPEEPQP